MEAQGERLLQDLLAQEKSLIGKVDEANAKARSIVEKATAEAKAQVDAARAKAEAMAQSEAEAGRKEEESVRQSVVSYAKEAAGALEAKAAANLESVVAKVLEKVLP